MLPDLSSGWQVLLFIWFIFEWILRLVMLYVVPKRKSPAAANGFLLLIMLLPVPGTIIFVMFANPKLPQIRRDKQREVDQLTQKELDEIQQNHTGIITKPSNETHNSIARLGSVLGGLPPMSGNSVQLSTDYEGGLKEIAKAIDKAEQYVHIEYFIIVLDESTEPIFKALEGAVKRGVSVRVLYDKLVSRSYPRHKEMIERLTNAGVQHHQMIPLSLMPGKYFTRPDLRNHRKIVVIDGSVAFTGSQNIVQRNYHRKDDLVYEELLLRIEGPAVWQMNNVFRSDWFPETGDTLVDLVEDEDMPSKAGDVIAQVLPSGPSHDEENNLRFYTSMVHAAKKRVSIVVPYFVPDDSFLDALTTAAQRGVEVVIINSAIIDKVIVGHAQRSYYEELLQAGVKIHLYKWPVFLHTKQVIIDDEVAIIGSSNLDVRSFALDLELNVILYDQKTVKELLNIEGEYIKKSDPVLMKHWIARPLKHKILESLARITAPLQ